MIRRLLVYGRVQGVGYRGWAVDTARALSLRGWVRNRRDGVVEILDEGSEETVAIFIERCGEGPAA
jgi:acylphosphatase